jgi:hypothetical protein
MKKSKFRLSVDYVSERNKANGGIFLKSFFGELLTKRNHLKKIKLLCTR